MKTKVFIEGQSYAEKECHQKQQLVIPIGSIFLAEDSRHKSSLKNSVLSQAGSMRSSHTCTLKQGTLCKRRICERTTSSGIQA